MMCCGDVEANPGPISSGWFMRCLIQLMDNSRALGRTITIAILSDDRRGIGDHILHIDNSIMTNDFLYIDENENRHRDISDLMIKALIKLDHSLSEIDDNLKLNNWRNPSSIWGELSRLIFRRNISKYRGKIRHLWYNNRCNVQNRFKTAVLQHKTSLTNVEHTKQQSQLSNSHKSEGNRLFGCE